MSNPLEADRNPIYYLCVDEGQYRQQTNLSCRLLTGGSLLRSSTLEHDPVKVY